jgi:hypothetical protein
VISAGANDDVRGLTGGGPRFWFLPCQAVMCALRALGGATLSHDGATSFDPRQEGSDLLRRWRQMSILR